MNQLIDTMQAIAIVCIGLSAWMNAVDIRRIKERDK